MIGYSLIYPYTTDAYGRGGYCLYVIINYHVKNKKTYSDSYLNIQV